MKREGREEARRFHSPGPGADPPAVRRAKRSHPEPCQMVHPIGERVETPDRVARIRDWKVLQNIRCQLVSLFGKSRSKMAQNSRRSGKC